MNVLCLKLILLHPRMFCAKFWWDWPIDSVEDFLISSVCDCYFFIISTWKRAWPFNWINIIKVCIVPSVAETGSLVLEKKMWKCEKFTDRWIEWILNLVYMYMYDFFSIHTKSINDDVQLPRVYRYLQMSRRDELVN